MEKNPAPENSTIMKTCAICLNDLGNPCINCETSSESLEIKCETTVGVCGQSFHDHCISILLKHGAHWIRVRRNSRPITKKANYL